MSIPELSVKDRIQVFMYLEGVRKEVHRNYVRKMFKEIPMLSYFAEHIIATDFFKIFFSKFSSSELA